jgi:hypothetical protein
MAGRDEGQGLVRVTSWAERRAELIGPAAVNALLKIT